MPEGDDQPESPYYGRARIAAGLAVIGLIGILYAADVLSPDFAVDSIQLGLLLGCALLFLGVEAGKRLLGIR